MTMPIFRRQRRERMIQRFDPKTAREAFEDIARRSGRYGFLRYLDDEAVEQIARELLTERRRVQRFNQRERARTRTRELALSDASR